MPKSAKKAASKVDSTPAVVEQPTEATKNGKRDAEESIENNVVSSKKQKIVNEGVSPAVETKKVKTKAKKIKIKKQENNSPEFEEKEKEEPKEPDAVVKNSDVTTVKNDKLDNESESNDRKSSDEEDAKATSEAKAPVEPAVKVEEESHDDKENSDEEPAEPQAVKEANIGSDSAEKEDESKATKKFDADVLMVDASSTKKAPQTSSTSQATESKVLFMTNLSFSIEKSDVVNFFKDAGKVVDVRFVLKDDRFAGYGYVEFATHDAAQKALKLDGELLLDRDVRLDFAREKCAYIPNNGDKRSSQQSEQSLTEAGVEMVDASSAKKTPQTPATPQATESKTLFMGNLSFSIGISDVINFFKDAGEVVEVRFTIRDGCFAGYGHVEFATHNAAQKALKLDGEFLLDRDVRLDFAKENSAYTPNNGNERSSQKSGQSLTDADMEMVDASSAKKAPQTSTTPQAAESKTLFMGNLSFSIKESDVLNFFKDAGEVVDVRLAVKDDRLAGFGHVEFATHDAAQKAFKLDGELLLDRNVRLDFAKERGAHTPSNGNERSSQKSGQSIKDADMEMVDASSAKKAPQTSATPQAAESKTLFMGNLSFSIKESDVLDFFKDAGEIVGVRLAVKDDRLAGFGHVEFATHDAAQKAFKLDGELLLDRNVRLDFATERGVHTPSNGNERSSQKSEQSQGLTVFVKGFGIDDGFDSVRSTLEEHFGQCGEITRMAIPKDFESGGPKGIAFIDFTNSEAFNKALELNGSEVSGCTITVGEGKQSSKYNDRDGGGRGGRGRSGGKGRGRGKGHGRGRGHGRGKGR